MKKLFYFSAMALAVSLFIYSCGKDDIIQNDSSKEGSSELVDKNQEIQSKADGTSCCASCTWSSCCVTCPSNLGVAACNCTQILLGILGSSATCGCGGAGLSKVDFNDENIDRYKILKQILKQKDINRINSLEKVIDEIIEQSSKNGKSYGRNRVLLEEFVINLNLLDIDEAYEIGIELRKHDLFSDLIDLREIEIKR